MRGRRREPGGRSTRPGRGRSAVLWGLGIFVLAQVVLRLAIDHGHREWRDPAFECKFNQLKKRLDDCLRPPATVIFFGSSMTAYGIRPDMLEEPLAQALKKPVLAFNLGTYGSGTFTQLLYLHRLLDRGIRPTLAVVEVTPAVHHCPDDAPPDIKHFPGNMLAGGDVELVSRYSKDAGLVGEWRQSVLVPIYGHRLVLLNHLASFLVPQGDRLALYQDMDKHGWLKMDIPGPGERRQGLDLIQNGWGPNFAKYAPGRPALRALEELCALLKTEKIPTLLVIMPEGPILRSLYNPAGAALVLKKFADLGRTFGFPLVNAREWIDEDMFSDSAHLTHEGAYLFTDRLGREGILPVMVGAK